MADVETGTQQVQELKKKLAEQEAKKDRPANDPELRRLRKALKRAQRALRGKAVLSMEEQVKRIQRLQEQVNVRLGVMTKTAKKPTGDPRVHSLRKKDKSFTRRLKRLGRLQKKAQPPAAS